MAPQFFHRGLVKKITGKNKTQAIEKWKEKFGISPPEKIKKGEYCTYFSVFSYGLTPSVRKLRAIKAYKNASANGCYIIVQGGHRDRVFQHESPNLPSVKQLEELRDHEQSFADIYVTDDKFQWTFVITHEDSEPGFGPYFSNPPIGWKRKED